jgi:hypothetical protein
MFKYAPKNPFSVLMLLILAGAIGSGAYFFFRYQGKGAGSNSEPVLQKQVPSLSNSQSNQAFRSSDCVESSNGKSLNPFEQSDRQKLSTDCLAVSQSRDEVSSQVVSKPDTNQPISFKSQWAKALKVDAAGDDIYQALAVVKDCAYALQPGFDHAEFEAKLIASIDQNSPDYSKRIAAVKRRYAACADVSQLNISADRIKAMYDSSAAKGQSSAQAYLLTNTLPSASRFSPTNTGKACELFKKSLTNPDTLIELIPLLSAAPRTALFGVPYDTTAKIAFSQSLDLVACQLAHARCTVQGVPLTELCAQEGKCSGYTDLEDYIKKNVLSPAEYELVSIFKSLTISALQSGDCSAVGLNQGAVVDKFREKPSFSK